MTAIDVDGLLEELAEQRRNHAGISTTSINLVAFVDDHELRRRMSQRIDELAERNVSRALLLSCEETEHTVRSQCVAINDTLVTHSEQIHLSVKDLEAEQLASVVHGLLVPAVRTVLLWGGEHLTDPRFRVLADIADAVILFSSARDLGTAPLREIVQMHGTAMEPKIRDLAFLRLLPWQDTIALFFDDPDLVTELPHINRVEVSSGAASEAYYFVGWLAGRLGWEPCAQYEFCNADGRSITMDIRQGPIPRRLQSIVLRTTHSVFSATMEDEADDIICLEVQGPKQWPHQCVPLHDIDMVSLVERAIFMPSTEIYSDTLRVVARLLEHTQ